MGAAFADIDHDGDLDIFITRLVDLDPPPGKPYLRFPDDFSPQSNLLFRNNLDGTFSEISTQAVGAGQISVLLSDVDQDRAVDFTLFDIKGRPQTYLNNKDTTFRHSDRKTDMTLRGIRPGYSRAIGDFDRDGAVDELILENGKPAILNRNLTRPANWLTVKIEGYAVPGQLKSNRMGIGATIEMRATGRWERSELRAGNGMFGNDAPEIHFDLGDLPGADFMRAVFPSGARSTLRELRANQIVKLNEPPARSQLVSDPLRLERQPVRIHHRLDQRRHSGRTHRPRSILAARS